MQRIPYKKNIQVGLFWPVLFLLASLSYSSLSKAADGEAHHSFVTCAIITSEHLTTLQLYQRGVSLDTALESLPRISREAKQRVEFIYQLADGIGILNSYADINTNFARCATLVYQQLGKPALDEFDYGYYFCAGENKIRFEILLHADRYMNLEKVLRKTPDTHISTAIEYYNLIENKGLLAAFDLTANNLKACLNNLQASR